MTPGLAGAGQVEGFVRVAAASRAGLVRAAARVVGANDAEDVVQDALVKAWRRLPGFDPRHGGSDGSQADRALRAYLYTAARNRARDWREQVACRRESRFALEPDGTNDAPAARAEDRLAEGAAARDQLRALLAVLPDQDRRVLLAVAQGVPTRAIGAWLGGVPRGTVKSWVHRARQRALAWRAAQAGGKPA